MLRSMKLFLFGATLAFAPGAFAFGWDDIEDAAKKRGEHPIVND